MESPENWETKTAAGLIGIKGPVNKILVNKHPKRKNNEIVAAMYAMYQTGKSLQEVGKVYKRTRQSVYDVFRTRGYQLRTKQMKRLQIVDGIKFTLMKGGYLRGTVNGERMLMHHYIWFKCTGYRIQKGYNIHHKDGDKENNLFENLELLTASDCTRIHSPHRNQFTAVNGSKIVRRHPFSGEVRLVGDKKFRSLTRSL